MQALFDLVFICIRPRLDTSVYSFSVISYGLSEDVFTLLNFLIWLAKERNVYNVRFRSNPLGYSIHGSNLSHETLTPLLLELSSTVITAQNMQG